jgi:putative transposase
MFKSNRKRNESSTEYFNRISSLPTSLDLQTILSNGKAVIDNLTQEIGTSIVEGLMLMERENISGSAYHPKPGYKKWSRQKGSIYLGKSKVPVMVPRLRDDSGEIVLPIYKKLKDANSFSEELLDTSLSGLAGRRYGEVIDRVGKQFGVHRSSVSRHIKTATAKRLKLLLERKLDDFEPFTILIDGVHRAKHVVMVAVGIDVKGNKQVLGLWEGATENAAVCEAMLSDFVSRGLSLHPNILWISDGGSGIKKALRDRYGKDLIHQRCTLHKKRNIEEHLPESYRAEFRRRYGNAIHMTTYEDARKELVKVLEWLRGINSAAARSLEEVGENLLTVHRIGVPSELRKSLMTTNAIESIFNGMSYAEKNVKRYRDNKMLVRWMAAVVLYREESFYKIRGHEQIDEVVKAMATRSFKLAGERLIA